MRDKENLIWKITTLSRMVQTKAVQTNNHAEKYFIMNRASILFFPSPILLSG